MPKYKISYIKLDYLNFYIDSDSEEEATSIANDFITYDVPEAFEEAQYIEGEWEENPNEDEYIEELED